MVELMDVNNTSVYKDSLTYPERSKLNGLKKDSWITYLSDFTNDN